MEYRYSYTTRKTRESYLNSAPASEADSVRGYSYTYDYQWVETPEKPIAVCQLREGLKVTLDSERLVVSRPDGSQERIPLREVEQLNYGVKRLMLPVISGGIISPFSFVSMMSQQVDFMIGAFVAVGGLLLFYYGMIGASQLTIRYRKVEWKIASEAPTAAVEAFVDQVNQRVAKRYARRWL